MKRIISILVSIILILSCAACGPKDQETPPPTPSDTAAPETPETSDTTSPSENEPPAPNEADGSTAPPQKITLNGQTIAYDEFPIPTADAFSLTGDDAMLYAAAVGIFNRQDCPEYFSEGSSDLILPMLTQYGKYQTDEGNTTFVVNFIRCFFFDLGSGLSDVQNPVYTSTCLNNLAAITLDKDGNLVTFAEAKDGTSDDEFSNFVHEICGPLTDLAEEIIAAGGILSEGERQVPDMNNYEEVVQQYLSYFFVG